MADEILKISEKVKSGAPTTSQDVYESMQRGFEKAYGVTINQLMNDDMLMVVDNRISECSSPSDFKKNVQFIKQSDMATSTGTQAFLYNPTTTGQIGQFGATTGVFNPAQYAMIMEGVAYKTLIPKLWGIQPPASPNDLVAQLVYLSKAAPISGTTEVFARVAEGRAGADVGFELKSVNVDWGRRIIHTPVTYELERVLAGRLPLQKVISDTFAELYAVAQDDNAFQMWYTALDAGTLEGDAFALYRDGVIADVDGMPAGYKCFYDLSDGTIKKGDSNTYGSATSLSTGWDMFDLLSYVAEWMSTVGSGLRTSARLLYTPDYFVLPPAAVFKLIRTVKAGLLTTVWINKADVPMWADENLFVGRLGLGGKMVDIWQTPEWLTLGNVTTDSPTLAISPGFAGKYQMMGAYSELTGPMTFIDPDFEVKSVDAVSVLRRRMANVHTLFSLNAERLLNASMSFLIKFLA
jgi:hypothetical protein